MILNRDISTNDPQPRHTVKVIIKQDTYRQGDHQARHILSKWSSNKIHTVTGIIKYDTYRQRDNQARHIPSRGSLNMTHTVTGIIKQDTYRQRDHADAFSAIPPTGSVRLGQWASSLQWSQYLRSTWTKATWLPWCPALACQRNDVSNYNLL